jgi:hypothetical protein
MSALLIAATMHQISVNPISNVIEVAWPLTPWRINSKNRRLVCSEALFHA